MIQNMKPKYLEIKNNKLIESKSKLESNIDYIKNQIGDLNYLY